MRKFDSKCPNCGETTLDSTNSLFLCNNCGYAPNGYNTILCPICNSYGYKINDGLDICDTCGWVFGNLEISEIDYKKEWKQKQQNFLKITSAIKDEIETFFIKIGVKYDSHDFYKLVTGLYNYLLKVTLPQKYTVILSNEIIDRSQHKPLITLFKKKFENGEDVSPWQSKSVLKSDYQDILFNFWNIKHLHLIEDSTKRSNDILLYIQNDSCVYFLDVVEHPQGAGWNNFNILKLVCQNQWMQYIGFIKLSDIQPNFVEGSLEPKIEDEEIIRKIYKSNINIGFTIDNISYRRNPLQGVVTSGDNLKVIEYYKKSLC